MYDKGLEISRQRFSGSVRRPASGMEVVKACIDDLGAVLILDLS